MQAGPPLPPLPKPSNFKNVTFCVPDSRSCIPSSRQTPSPPMPLSPVPTPLCSSWCKFSKREAWDRMDLVWTQIKVFSHTWHLEGISVRVLLTMGWIVPPVCHPHSFSGIHVTFYFSQSAHWPLTLSINNSCLVWRTLSSDKPCLIPQLSSQRILHGWPL